MGAGATHLHAEGEGKGEPAVQTGFGRAAGGGGLKSRISERGLLTFPGRWDGSSVVGWLGSSVMAALPVRPAASEEQVLLVQDAN